MIKNLPYTAKEHEIKDLFERYGELVRFLVSPYNTLAIAEYESKSNAIMMNFIVSMNIWITLPRI